MPTATVKNIQYKSITSVQRDVVPLQFQLKARTKSFLYATE